MEHLDNSFHDHEMNVGDGAWERWAIKAEKIAGHSLDGDNSDAAKAAGTADGYSLDNAFEAWKSGLSPAVYIKSIKR